MRMESQLEKGMMLKIDRYRNLLLKSIFYWMFTKTKTKITLLKSFLLKPILLLI